jgi:uncharacterized CHY-type Zn-finger protein
MKALTTDQQICYRCKCAMTEHDEFQWCLAQEGGEKQVVCSECWRQMVEKRYWYRLTRREWERKKR